MSVVGKYRYTMMSPAEHDRVLVIVDIILVGRTKIITLHSSLWLENHTDRAVSFRLHVPLTPLTAPTHPANSSQDPTGNIIIGPFPSGSGAQCHLLLSQPAWLCMWQRDTDPVQAAGTRACYLDFETHLILHCPGSTALEARPCWKPKS